MFNILYFFLPLLCYHCHIYCIYMSQIQQHHIIIISWCNFFLKEIQRREENRVYAVFYVYPHIYNFYCSSFLSMNSGYSLVSFSFSLKPESLPLAFLMGKFWLLYTLSVFVYLWMNLFALHFWKIVLLDILSTLVFFQLFDYVSLLLFWPPLFSNGKFSWYTCYCSLVPDSCFPLVQSRFS